MPLDTYITTHIHTDGPIPGPHSLLTLVSAAHKGRGGRPISMFTTNIRELPGATLHPAALQTWRRRAEDWLSTRRASRPPVVAMNAYARWVEQLPGRTVFLTDPADPDYLFLYWYLQRFAAVWPFTGTRGDAELYDRMACTTLCPLAGCHTQEPVLARTS